MLVLAPRTGARSQRWTVDSHDFLVPALPYASAKPAAGAKAAAAATSAEATSELTATHAPLWLRAAKLKEVDGQIRAMSTKGRGGGVGGGVRIPMWRCAAWCRSVFECTRRVLRQQRV